MSLLLEALKKAEKAKEEAQRARSEAKPDADLKLQDEAPGEAPKHVMTRTELPDISQPLEILSDDIAPPPPPASAAGRPAARAAPRSDPSRPALQSGEAAGAQSAERAAARKSFEAKYKEPNPRLPFYLTMGALGIAVLGTVGYFWYQLRPAPSLVNRNPPVTAPLAAADPAQARPRAAPARMASLPIEKAPIPGLPDPSIVPQNPQAPTHSPLAAAAPQAEVPKVPAPRRPVRHAPREKPAAQLERRIVAQPSVSTARPAPQVNPRVQAAYQSYLAGDMALARTTYEEALRDEPHNRDALLGLAAADIRLGRFEAAEAAYLRLLRADPGDANAEAGLIALRAGRMDPLATESRLKTLLAAEPEAHVLNFTLGNQFAQQGRWPEAQQQYFKAFAAAPDNADFAYNLAVSLEHLRQPKLALQYYQRALALAERHGASFDPAAARERVAQLGK
ncbi:MAG TPA: tetratricopeptide repeat protein [Burkholderiales bacterium]|nr:tetratricopeptide repeat protein [Burkholderiales bacterium]